MKNNILANIFGKVWSVLSGFLFIPLYIKYLGFEAYSVISFSLVITGMMAVLDAGLTATLSREFSRLDHTLEDKNRIFRTIETIYFILIGFVILVVFSLSSVIAAKYLNLINVTPQEVSYFIKIISFDIGFQLLLRFYLGGLIGLEKQIKANVYQVGWGILRNGLVLIAIIYIPTLEMFFIWQSVATIIFTILFRLALNKEITGYYRLGIDLKIEKKVVKGIWKFALGVLLISLVASLNTQMDKIAISKLLSIESLGYYTLAISLSTGILVIVSPISVALLPRFTALFSDNKNVEAANLFTKVSIVLAILVFSIMANMSFFAKELIWAWTGNDKLARESFEFIPILAFTYTMLALSTISYDIAIANGYTKLNNILGLISLFVTLPFYFEATKRYGAIGAAAVYCIVQTIITIIYLYIINKKYIKSSLYTVFIKQMIFPLLISVTVAYSFSNIPHSLHPNRFLILILIGISTVVTVLITGLLLLYKDKAYFKNLLLEKKI